MTPGRIVLISGTPGTGKSTVAALLARDSQLAASLCLRTDSFYEALRKGAVPPHLPGSEAQNQVVIEAFLAAAVRFAQGGYDVIVDGVVGPWFLQPWLAAARAGGIPSMMGEEEGMLYGPPGDAQNLSNALAALLSDPGRAAALGQAARRRALATHDPAANAGTLLAIYRTITGEESL